MTTAREALEKAMTIATLNSDPVTIFVKISALRDALPQVSVVNDTPAMNITVWKDGSYLCQAVGDDVCSRDDENWLVSIPLVPAFAAQSETQRSHDVSFEKWLSYQPFLEDHESVGHHIRITDEKMYLVDTVRAAWEAGRSAQSETVKPDTAKVPEGWVLVPIEPTAAYMAVASKYAARVIAPATEIATTFWDMVVTPQPYPFDYEGAKTVAGNVAPSPSGVEESK